MIRALAIAVLLAGCGGTAATPTPEPTAAGRDISGTFVLHAQDGLFNPNNACVGDGGYSDLRQGFGLTLRDGENNILSTARLGAGDGSSRNQCVFEFVFEDVPDADFYSVQSERGELTYSRADMEARGWTVALEIGN